MRCLYETCLKLTISRFYVIWAKNNYFEKRLMVLSQKVESKVLRMASYLKYFDDREKNGEIEMSFHTLAFKVFVLTL